MPSRVSQNPEAKRKTTAKISSHEFWVVVRAYVTADASASIKPIVLILLGVKPILCAAIACEVSIC